jgi:hypothetical protein
MRERVSTLCLSCHAQRNFTNLGQLCNLCERQFIAWVAQLPKAKAKLTRREWVNAGSPRIDRAEDYCGKKFSVR